MSYHSPFPKDEIFTRYWKRLMPLVVERSNFREGHLITLEILCKMLAEEDRAQATIDLIGSFYESESRNGLTLKPRPELQQINALRKEISNYLKLLGITLTKDESRGNTADAKDEWS